MTEMTSPPPSSHYYDFAQPEFWGRRIDNLDDLVDGTFKLFDSVAMTLEGWSAREILGLFHQAGEKDLTSLVDEALRHGSEGAPGRLAEALNKALQQPGTGQVTGHLGPKLITWLRHAQIPLTPTSQHAEQAARFDRIQMLNIYMLISGLNNFLWGPVRNLVQASLDQHKQAGAPPPLHLLRQSMRLLGADATLLQRALVQRRWEPMAHGGYTRSMMARSLVVTDKLAAMALAPIRHRLPGGDAVIPLTYFSRETHIHRLPYSDRFVLIGLSYDLIRPAASRRAYGGESLDAVATLPAFELMAIPHEVGHFVYRHARLSDGRTFAELGAAWAHTPYGGWCEEIFADVYGCLVAGPLAPLGLQAILATGDPARLAVDDGEHPIPLVRPFLLSVILQELGRQQGNDAAFARATAALDGNWGWLLAQRGFVLGEKGAAGAPRIRLPGPAADYRETVVNPNVVIQAVRPMVEAFVRRLWAEADRSPWASQEPGALSADIPWCRADHGDLRGYDAVMADLTGDKTLNGHIPGQQLVGWGDQWLRARGKTADEQLAHFVEDWTDSGPTGLGDHPG